MEHEETIKAAAASVALDKGYGHTCYAGHCSPTVASLAPNAPRSVPETPDVPPVGSQARPGAFPRRRRTIAERRYDHVSERDWMAQVIETTRQLYGDRCLIYHSHDSRSDEWSADSGFPDLVIVLLSRAGFRRRLLFIECKKESGKLTQEQTNWRMGLDPCLTAEYYIWKPSDVDTMLTILKKAPDGR